MQCKMKGISKSNALCAEFKSEGWELFIFNVSVPSSIFIKMKMYNELVLYGDIIMFYILHVCNDLWSDAFPKMFYVKKDPSWIVLFLLLQWNLQGKITTKVILQLHLFSRVVFPSLLLKKSKRGFIKKNMIHLFILSS